MIQLPRFLVAAPLAAINLADSGADWFKEFLFSNHSHHDITKGENLITYIDQHGTKRSFNGRLLYAGIKQSTHSEILNEQLNVVNEHRVLFRLAKQSLREDPKLLNLGLVVFEIATDYEDLPPPLIKNLFVLGVCQDAKNPSNMNVECIEHLQGNASGIFKNLNNKHVDVIGLLHALISTTRHFAYDSDKYELIAKKLIAEQNGLYGASRPKILNMVEDSIGGEIICKKATLLLLFLDSEIRVSFELNDYHSIADAAYVAHQVETKIIQDGSAYMKDLDFDALVKKHLDVNKLFEVLRHEYKERNTPSF